MSQNLTEVTASLGNSKAPRLIMPRIFAFAPNRATLGGTAYLIVDKSGNILLDCPADNAANQQFIQSQGGIRALILTHRGAIGKNVRQMQQTFNCQVIIQEQEAYLLPEIEITSFVASLYVSPDIEVIWTPGHSPGSSCLYVQQQEGILFTGRHLLPKSPESIAPLRTAKTFHWGRQLDSIAKLSDRFNSNNLSYIMPGANTGYLRGRGYLEQGYEKLVQLDLIDLRSVEVI
ncbi:MAG: MBL fold metallo-hydrolase [Cyanobacteria bacterium P01_C01_bin.72]